MKIEFYGAAKCVTGSCHILKVNDKNVLLDCGLFQGRDEKERGNDEFPFDARKIDYVILSHAHIDHSGRIPLLYKKGFKGEVICTKATKELCSIMLPDSGYIQETETEWKNRKRIRQGLGTIEPLYTAKMAELSMYLFRDYDYEEVIEVFDGFKVIFKEAGHLLGSSIVEMYIREEYEDEVKIVYTGDLGNTNKPIIKDPSYINYADYIIMETTYGDRLHGDMDWSFKELVNIITDTFRRGGNVIIPSFSVGRTQEVLYALSKYVKDNTIKDVTIFVDSPLAANTTKIYEKCSDYYDEEMKELMSNGLNPLNFKGVIYTNTPQESMRINKFQGNAIIISASGMCEAGRIKHHLKHNLWRKECSIVFVGYQAEGTLGRSILDGNKKVNLFGEPIAVNAKIYNLEGLSGHADKNGLIEWIDKLMVRPKEIFLVHGDTKSQEGFKELLDSKGFKSKIMDVFETYYINEHLKLNDENIKYRIIKLLNSIDDIEYMSKEVLIKEIEKAINNNEKAAK
ncbi:MBL fold metallo-hydrolase RNA specificity domain-containing protein [Clostridium botulinum]|uniref:MBL fold metallo-hydrolase RNA specificity domain-containing protein n=2 Tax=Clostridium botulinum TaxID=1491 RepID=UPI0002F5D534|nr:MBL fold metallo-hydrolase [Clostridium botulinum]KEI04186.1 metallo-beta-lactamase [Clostridium botulinum D str. 16868]KLU75826.1 metallo-beta-lactamase [Clostridium botulinum V891]KOA77523.1 metallo-beta-lactamase [Clostridium botulinum]KOA93467.1 metallo-beta-lactamase [Clostridium botulinum]KOC36012.1 metallo-beta-lactamase [Clostridium botulinum]